MRTYYSYPAIESAYETVQDEGSSLPQQTVLDFQGAGVTVTDGGTKTIVTIPGGTPTPLGYYGAFQDVTNQTAAVINTGYPMKLGVTDLSNQVTVVSGSRITIANTGIYNIQWSGQFTNPLAAEHDVTVWLRKNGVDVPGSAGVVLVPKKHGTFDGHTLPAWNYLIDPIAGDYYEFVWSTENTSVYLSFTSAGSPPPSSASVIVTVTQQSGIMAGTGMTALNGLTGAVQTFVNDTNVTVVSSGTTHTLTWAGTLADARIASAATWNAKQNAITGAATTITTVDLTASRVLVSDASGKVAANSVTATTLSYLDATSSIQTQLNNVGEWINLGGTVLSPADSTSYNFGLNVQLAPATSTAAREFSFIRTGTVTRVAYTVAMAVPGTSETVAVYLRNITTATDNLIGNITMDAGINSTGTFNFTPSITIANITDKYTIKFVCPAWVTNPTGVYSNVRLFNKS